MTTIQEAMRACTSETLRALAQVNVKRREEAGRGLSELANAELCAAVDELRQRERLAGELDEGMTYGRVD
jgi:hypothetical protein